MPFPNSPTNGQEVTVNNTVYQYNTTKSAWIKKPSQLVANASIANGTTNITCSASGDITFVRAGVTIATFGASATTIANLTGQNIISNSTSNVTVAAGSDITVTRAGSNVATFGATALSVNGISSSGAVTGTTGTFNTGTFNTSVQTVAITSGSSSTAGTITGNWSLTGGSKLQATYADLAENYQADTEYESGTVLMIGGSAEVTLATDETRKVIGVVTTNPAYIMNKDCDGQFVATIALQGRVPCKVKGPVAKGDMLVSAGGGYAKASADPKLGSVIGKALEDFNDSVGVIEIIVDRL